MHKLIASAIAMLLIAACSSTPLIPGPESNESAALGIAIKVRVSGLATYRADAVYFVRSCPAAEACAETLQASHFAKDGRAYLLNAQPGEYRAVAAAFESGVPGDNSVYFAYFPAALASATTTPLAAGEWAYAGSYTVFAAHGLCPEDAEPDQLRHAQLIEPDTPKCGVWKPLLHKLGQGHYLYIGGKAYIVGSQTFHYRGTAHEPTQAPGGKADFLSRMRADLEGAGWKAPQ